MFQENREMMLENRQLKTQLQEQKEKMTECEKDLGDYLNLLDEKDKEIADLRSKVKK